MSWYSKGFDAAEEQAASSGNFTRDFFLKDGETAVIRILRAEPDEPFNIRSHFVNNRWVTCPQGIDGEDCPVCESGKKATNQFVFNVIDTRDFVDKNGKSHKDEVKLWRVGIKLLKLLKRRAANYGPLNTYDIEVTRLGSGTNTTYDIDVLTKSIGSEINLTAEQVPFVLEDVLAPKSRAELIGVMSGAAAENSDDESDDMPWKK